MRKLILAVCFISFLPVLHGQNVQFGVKLDPQISWLRGSADEIQPEKPGFGLDAGLIADFYFTPNYAFSSGISLSTSGGTIFLDDSATFTLNDDEEVIGKEEINFRMQHIRIPLGLKLKSREFGYTRFFAQLGLTPEIKVKSQLSTDVSGYDDETVDEIAFFNLNYHFGGGIEYSLGENTAVTAGVIYHNGFTDILSLKEYALNLNTLTFRVGFMF